MSLFASSADVDVVSAKHSVQCLMVPTMSSTSDAAATGATESTPEETGALAFPLAFPLALPLGFAFQADATAAAFFYCARLFRKACTALVSGDMVTNKLSNLLMSDSLRTSHEDPCRVGTNEPQRREEHPRELVVWQFTAVFLEFVQYSLVGVVNNLALHLQFGAPKILAHHVRVLLPQAACYHHLVEVQCSEKGVELYQGFVEVGSDEFQVRCLVARLASLTLTVSLTVRRLFSLGSRFASLLLQAALLCLLLAFLMPLLLDDGGLQVALRERALRANAVETVACRIEWSRTSGGVRSSNNVTSVKPPFNVVNTWLWRWSVSGLFCFMSSWKSAQAA